MRFSFAAILLAISLNLSAFGFSQEKVSVNFKKTKLEKALKEIEERSSYRFVFSSQIIPQDARVTIFANDIKVDELLAKMLLGTGLQFNVSSSGLVVISKSPDFVTPPPVIIKGRITDEQGNPLVGVSVSEKKAKKGTTTDDQGNFSIEANSGELLEVSYVGYVTQLIKVGSSAMSLDIKMQKSANDMGEVVVMGYSTTTKRKTTASVATVDAGKLSAIPVASVNDALLGRVNGLILVNSSGAPGVKSSISIRGGGTPLFIIDGIIRSQNDYDNLNPNDIATITFLKDAAATAVYGSLGANGGVVITTKKGAAGKTSINYGYNQVMSQPTIYPTKLGSYERVKATNEVLVREGKTPVPDSIVQFYKDQTRPFLYPNTDWRKVGMKDWGTDKRHDLSLSTGTKQTTLYSSLSYYDQGSILRTNQNYNKRVTYRLNTVSDFDKINLKVTTGIDGFVETNIIPNSSQGSNYGQYIGHIQDKDPMQLAYNEFGLPSANTTDNPAVELSPLSGYNRNQARVNNIVFAADYTASFLKGLHFKFNGNYNQWASRNKSWNVTAPSYANGSKVALLTAPPTLSEYRGEGTEMNLQWFITYNRQFKQHEINFTGVYETNQLKSSNVSASRVRYQILFDQFVAGPTLDQTTGGSEFESGRAGYIAQLGYNYKQRYYLELSGRYDGNDFYPTNNRWGFFPSLSGSYIVSDEKFMSKLNSKNILNLLKLRASYGTVGLTNAGFGPFAFVPGYNINANAWVINGQLVQGTSEPGNLPSTNFTWYSTKSSNIGIDFASLNNRLSGSWDYFYMRTTGYTGANSAIYSTTLGIGLPPVNVTKQATRRHGTEVIIAWGDKIGRSFNYKITGVYSYFNTINEFANEDSATLKNPYTRNSGLEGSYLQTGYINNGFYQSNQDLLNGPRRISSTNVVGGDLRYEDVNGDGKIDGSDFRRIGHNTFPRSNFGVTIDMNYKGFFFTTTIAGSGKRDRYIGNVIQGATGRPFVYGFMLNYWTPENKGALYPRPVSSDAVSNNNFTSSDFWLIRSGYVRVKYLQIGYDFKQGALKNIAVFKSLKVFISGTNLLTSAKSMKYFVDPESDINNYGYPIQRTISFGANIGL